MQPVTVPAYGAVPIVSQHHSPLGGPATPERVLGYAQTLAALGCLASWGGTATNTHLAGTGGHAEHS